MASCSISKLDRGRYQVRWREPVRREGNRLKYRARKRTVSSMRAATALRDQILLDLETQGIWTEPMAPAAPETAPDVDADAEEAAVAYLRERAANGAARSSVQRWGYALVRWFRTARQVHGISDDDAVLVTTFTRGTFTRCKLMWQDEGLSPQTQCMTTRQARELWLWTSDEPDRWPGTPTPPRGRGLLPQAPVYSAPPAPTAKEMDAVIRWLAADGRRNVSTRVAIVARYTGLRASQILALRRDHLDLDAWTLRVESGKSRREKASPRVIPVSKHMVALLEDVLARPPQAPLIRCEGTPSKQVRLHLPTATFRKAWEAVTAAGHAREEVWSPPDRGQARPIHAFRSGFQAELRNLGAPDWVIDQLIGHRGRTRDLHYVDHGSVMGKLREWIDMLPAVEGISP